MAKQLRPRRGSTDANASLTGALGEVTVDTTKHTLRVHDGSTKGGTELARVADIPTKVSQLSNDAGYLKSHQDISNLATKTELSSGLSGYLPLTGGSLTGTLQVRNIKCENYTNKNFDFINSHDSQGAGWYLSGDDHVSGNWEKIWTSGNLNKVSVLSNDAGYLTSHQSLANCYKITGGALNSGAQISRATYGTSWINGRNAALVRQTSAPGDAWGPIGSCKVTSGSWDFGCLQNSFYFSYATDTNFNAGTNATTLQLIITPTGVSIAGTCSVSGALYGATVKATSDKNLKTDFSEVKYDLSSLKAYRYKFKEGEDKEYHVGLIAQEVQEIIPEAVSKVDDHLVLDYNSVVAALVAKVNDLQKQIDELKESK